MSLITIIFVHDFHSYLRNVNSWAEDREVFNEEATKVREAFNANMSVTGKYFFLWRILLFSCGFIINYLFFYIEPALISRLLREGKEKLQSVRHPDAYIQAFMPGGTLFMRNPAFPNEALYPDGIPEHVSRRRLNIDMSNVPDDQEYANYVFVDSANKQYWIDK